MTAPHLEPDAPPRVLVVDDDSAIRGLIRYGLADEGFEVSEAADGAEALLCVQRQAFDAIVLDLEMPRVDGRTFHRMMHEQGRAVPTVIVSAFGGRRAARELGVAAALEKPFDLDELALLVRRVISGASDRPGAVPHEAHARSTYGRRAG